MNNGSQITEQTSKKQFTLTAILFAVSKELEDNALGWAKTKTISLFRFYILIKLWPLPSLYKATIFKRNLKLLQRNKGYCAIDAKH